MSIDDITPERLDALLRGSTPRDDDERDAAALLAQVRAAEPSAPDALRARLEQTIAAPTPGAPPPGRIARWRTGLRAHRVPRLAWAAPVAVALLIAAIAVPALMNDDAGPDAASPQARVEAPAPEAAPPTGVPEADAGAVPLPATGVQPETVPDATLRVRVPDAAALRRARAAAVITARAAGGQVAASAGPLTRDGITTARLDLRVPTARADTVLAALARLGTAGDPARGDPDPGAPQATVRLLLTTGA